MKRISSAATPRLRWYQKQAVAAVFDYLRTEKGAPCVVLPTGSGKTHVLAELCRQVVAWGGRALVLAHVKELLQQSAEKLSSYVDPSLVGIYSAGLNERTTDAPIVVAGIQSVYQRAAELGERHLVVVDEAHLIPPDGCGRYRQFLEEEKTVSPKARLVGLTATPYRLGCGWITKDRAGDDDEKFDRLLDAIVYEAPVAGLIADGTLSAVVSRRAARSFDFFGVKTTRGDFDESEVEARLLKGDVLTLACEEIVRLTRNRRKVLIFCNRLESSRRCAAALRRFQNEFDVAIVDGSTPSGDRDALIRRFKGEEVADLFGNVPKRLKFVCNVGVLTTGFDAPNVDCVVLLRPTKSLALYQQMVGRGLRRCEEKENCLVLDYGGNVERLGPIDVPNPNDPKKWRTCQACGSVVDSSYPCCPVCGERFPVPPSGGTGNPNRDVESRASDASITSDGPPVVEEWDVESVEYGEHYKKDAPPDAPPTLQVSYKVVGVYRPIREWLCPEHENNWVRNRFVKWWTAKSKIPAPATVATAKLWAENGALATPKRIKTTRKNDKDWFPRVEWLDQSDKPDFDPTNVKTDEEEFYEGFEEFEDFSGDRDADLRADDDKNFEIRELYAVPQSCPPAEKKTVRCQNCGEWNDYGLEDYSGFCWAYNCEQNGTSSACSDKFKERFIDPDLPF